MSTFAQSLLAGIILAALSGLTFLAYQHSEAYRLLGTALISSVSIFWVMNSAYSLGELHSGVKSLQAHLDESADKTVKDIQFTVNSVVNSLSTLARLCLFCLPVIAYLGFLFILPKLL